MTYEKRANKLWEGFESFRSENRLQDTELDNHLFDLDNYGQHSRKKAMTTAKKWMHRWCEHVGKTFLRIEFASEDAPELNDHRFYFEPPFESDEEMHKAMSDVFGFDVLNEAV